MATYRLPLLVCLLAGCTGCGSLSPSSTPEWDHQFGMRARAALALLVAQPQAPVSDTAAGMDGRKAGAAYQRYQKSASEPAQSGTSLVGNNH